MAYHVGHVGIDVRMGGQHPVDIQPEETEVHGMGTGIVTVQQTPFSDISLGCQVVE